MTNLWTMLYVSMGITLTGLALLLFKRLFRDKLSARWHYLIWLVLAVRIVLPPSVRLFYTNFSLNSIWQGAMQRLRSAVESGRDSLLSAPFGTDGGDLSLLAGTPFAAWSLTDRLFAVYVVGVLAVLCYDAAVYCRLRWQIRQGRAVSPAWQAWAAGVAEKYDLPKPREIRICSLFETPFLCGIAKPVLVVPESMAEGMEETVLLHELLHLKHHDVWINFALHALQAVQWWNPLVYLFCGIIRNDSEALCDQRVLERLAGEEKRQYGLLLLGMADHRHSGHIGTTSMANGAKNIKTRVQRIADFGRVPKGASFVTACITVLLCLASVSYGYPQTTFDTSGVETEQDLERLLEDTRYFTVSSPEMALNIYWDAVQNGDLAKMALIVPQERFAAYRAWALETYRASGQGGAQVWEALDTDYAYCVYPAMNYGTFYMTGYAADAVEGIALWGEPLEEGDQVNHFPMRIAAENGGWRIDIGEKESGTEAGLYPEGFLPEDAPTQHETYGDWSIDLTMFTHTSYYGGFSGFAQLWGNTAEEGYTGTLDLFWCVDVEATYTGEEPLSAREIPVLVFCAAAETDADMWEAIENSGALFDTTSTSRSDGAAWAIPSPNMYPTLSGAIWQDTFAAVAAYPAEPWELRLYTQNGERLAAFPVTLLTAAEEGGDGNAAE